MHIYIPFDLKVSVYTVEMHCWFCVKDCLKDKDASSCEGYDYGQSFYLSVWYHLLFLRLVLLWLMWVCLMDCPTPAELKVRLQIQWLSKISTRVGKDRIKQCEYIFCWLLRVVVLACRQMHHSNMSMWLPQLLFRQHLLFGNKECVLSAADTFLIFPKQINYNN